MAFKFLRRFLIRYLPIFRSKSLKYRCISFQMKNLGIKKMSCNFVILFFVVSILTNELFFSNHETGEVIILFIKEATPFIYAFIE